MAYGTFFGRSQDADTLHPQDDNVFQALDQSRNAQTQLFKYKVTDSNESLKAIAKKHQLSVNTLCELNPEFKGKTTKKTTKVHAGQAIVVDRPETTIKLPPTPDEIDNGWGQMHVVSGHDTMESIALLYNTTVDDIRKWNRQHFPVGERAVLRPNQMLCIRVVNTSDLATRNIHQQQTIDKLLSQGFLVHEVTSDDTLESVTKKYNISLQSLLYHNREYFPKGHRLELAPKMKLLIKCNETLTDPQAEYLRRNVAEVKLTKQIHIVEHGDTPPEIAAKYNMKLSELREFNRAIFPKGYRGEIRPGQHLVVKRLGTN